MNLAKGLIKTILNIGQTVVAFMAIGILVYLYLIRPFQVKGMSMHPTFKNKEYLLTNLLAYKSKLPEYGDVVIFRAPNHAEFDYIKRVIGKPGDTVKVKNNKIYLNGMPLDESQYLDSSVDTVAGSFMDEGVEITVPEEEYFLVGDNRPGSSDSRDYGPVPFKNVYGQVWLRVWPLDTFGVITNPYDD